MSEYNAKDAVSIAFEGNVNGFRDTVNNLLLDKIYDAVQMKKFDVSANMFNDEVVEEEVDLEDIDALSEEEQIDEVSDELKDKYKKKVMKKAMSKQGSKDLDNYQGRTYTGDETPDGYARGQKLDKHVDRVKKMNAKKDAEG